MQPGVELGLDDRKLADILDVLLVGHLASGNAQAREGSRGLAHVVSSWKFAIEEKSPYNRGTNGQSKRPGEKWIL